MLFGKGDGNPRHLPNQQNVPEAISGKYNFLSLNPFSIMHPSYTQLSSYTRLPGTLYKEQFLPTFQVVDHKSLEICFGGPQSKVSTVIGPSRHNKLELQIFCTF